VGRDAEVAVDVALHVRRDDRPIAAIMCDTLVERVTGAAHAYLVGHGPIPADVAVRLAADTKTFVRRLLTDPVTGSVATADASRRRLLAVPGPD
jgi:hypothetical protein